MANRETAEERQDAEIKLAEESYETETTANIRHYLDETAAIQKRRDARITAARRNYNAEVKEEKEDGCKATNRLG